MKSHPTHECSNSVAGGHLDAPDILLTHGYFMDEDPHEQIVRRPYPPLGLLYLATYLKTQGYTPEIYDATFGSPEELALRLEQSRPPLVGIYTNLITRQRVLEIIRCARHAGAKVILGGPESANYPEAYLDRGADVVVFGEGEETLRDLLKAFERDPELTPGTLQQVHGIAFRTNGTVHRTPPRQPIRNLDVLPIPNRDFIPIQAYLDTWKNAHGYTSISLITARGCPYHCTWCSHAVFGYSHRRRSPQNVIDEIRYLKEKYAPDRLWYADDVFTIHPAWFRIFVNY